MTLSQTGPDQLRPAGTPGPGGDTPGHIVRIEQARRPEAIERLVGTGTGPDRAAAERFLHYARSNQVCLDGLWALQDDAGRVKWSVLAVPSPGRTAMVFSSHPRRSSDVPAIAGLVDHACRHVADPDVDLAQALLEPTERLEREMLLAAGFSELAVLSYLERPLTRAVVPPPEWPDDVKLQAYRPELDEALASILEQSYQQTLDCPGLYGLRHTRDILAGHKATGKFNPRLWTLLWLDERPAGAVLLNPFPAHKTVELVYLGLAPFARRRGLGKALLRHGLAQLRGRPERSLTLAVDQRNTPAIRLYEREGLRPVVERVALIRSLRAPVENA